MSREAQPDLPKEIRIQLAKLVEAIDCELVAEAGKFCDWWLDNHLAQGFGEAPPETVP